MPALVELSGRDVLMVIDNCERVAEAAAAALDALAWAVPGLRLLATSREPLGTDAENVLALGPLGVPAGSHLRDVQASAAGQLFLDRARAASSRFRPDETSAVHIAAICRRLDGLPLAIELAAVRIRDLDVMELAQGLRDTIRVLEQPARGVRQRSLSSAVEWSWQLLDDTERRLLRRLAVLPGEFTLALAEIIGPGQAAVDVRSILMRLVERSLVNMRLTPGEPARYWLLGVIRAATLERADPAADDQVASAHARFFCQVAQDAAYAHCHPASATAVPAGFDQPNILAALAWSAAHDLGLADRLLVSVSRLAEVEPSRQALELIRDVAVGCPSGLSCEALARAAVTVTFLSLDDAGQLARWSGLAAAGDRDNAFACWASGWVRAYRHEEGAALGLLDRVITYARNASDPWLEASALQARGIARISAEEAFGDWEQAVTRFVVAGDLTSASNVRYMLAIRAVEARTRLASVPVWLEACEAYASGQGLRHERAHIRYARGSYERLRGHPGTARRLLAEVLPVFRKAGDLRCVARTLLELAQPSVASDPAARTDLLLESLRAAAIAGDPAMHARILADLTTAGFSAGNLILAARCAGALESLGTQPSHKTADPAYATFVEEGRAGGIELLTRLYPGPVGTGTGIPG